MRSSLLRYAFLLTLLLAWLLPYGVVPHTYPIPTFYAEYTAWALYLIALVALGSVLIVERSTSLAAMPRIALMPLAFALLLLLQRMILPTTQPTLNWLGAGFVLMAFATAHLGFWTERLNLSSLALRTIAVALILGGLFAVFCQVVQLLGVEARFSPFVVAYRVVTERRPFGNMAQANHLATYISFAMAAAVFLVQTRRISLLLWIPLAIIFYTGEALTVSRTPLLQSAFILCGAIVMAFAHGQEWRPGTRGPLSQMRLLRNLDDGASALPAWRRWLVPILLIVLFFAVNQAVRWANIRYALQLDESAADRFRDIAQISPRLALWRYGLAMFSGHPWLGVGWGEFPHYQYLLVDKLGTVEIANNSHNIVIDLLAKTGIVGTGIVLIGMLMWLIRVLRAPCSAQRIFCLTLLGVFTIHAMVEYPQQYMFFLLPMAFVIGLLETRPARRFGPRVAQIAVGVVAAVGIGMAYPTVLDYRRAEVLYYGSNPAVQYTAAPSRMFGAWGAYGLATLQPLSRNNLAQNLSIHEAAISLLPGEVVLKRYAVLLALSGQQPAALEQVKKLKIFADALGDWSSALADLYHLCDEQGTALAPFKAKLVALYGATITPLSNNDDDADDD